MIIKKIIVRRFRALRGERTLEFTPGLNIIKGTDNEAGKSSLRMAITKALYQDPTTTRREVQALTSWGTDEPWEVVLEFNAGAGSYSLIKNFKDRSCELASNGPGGFVARNKDTINEKIIELTGCPSEAFFESTACIGQDEFVRIIQDSVKGTKDNPVGTITKKLQERLSGTEGTDVHTIINNLYAKTHRKDAAGPYSHLNRIAERVAELRSNKTEQEQKVNDVLEKRRTLTRTRLELEQINRDLPSRRDLLTKNKRLLELQKEITRDKAQYSSFKKANELKDSITRFENELRVLVSFTNSEDKMKQVELIRSRIANLSEKNSAVKDDAEILERQKPASWSFITGIALTAGGLAGLMVNPFLWTVAIPGIVLLVYWVVTRRAWQKQIATAMQKIDNMEGESGHLREEEHRLLAEFDCANYEEFRVRFREYHSLETAKRDSTNQLEAILAGRTWSQYIEENADIDVQISAKLKELQQLESFKLEPLALQELEREVNGYCERENTLGREKGALEKFLQYIDAEKDQLANIEEELADLEQQKAFWERKRKVYELTRDILEQAHNQTLSRAADLLEADINRSMARITAGKYNRVKINESDLSIQAFSPEKNDWVDVTQLSRATQDQFYICARLMLVKLITGGKKPPILLDDPFVNFHAKRLKEMIPLLQDITREEYQIFLFTCSDAYDYLGNAVSIS